MKTEATPAWILATCAAVVKRGEYFQVHMFDYRNECLRRQCMKLKHEGKLRQAKSDTSMLAFYRPEDVPVIDAARKVFADEMKKIHAGNVEWHLEQARRFESEKGNPKSLYHYHMDRADEEGKLSA